MDEAHADHEWNNMVDSSRSFTFSPSLCIWTNEGKLLKGISSSWLAVREEYSIFETFP